MSNNGIQDVNVPHQARDVSHVMFGGKFATSAPTAI